jgi:tetratricopeptide (TPR) repeat protein
MNTDPVRSTPKSFRIIRLLVAASITSALLLTASGCEELKARRKVQAAGKHYERGEFEQAAQLYEEVLEITDTGHVADVAHYNAGITYNKLFRPGVDTKENLAIASRTTEHFGVYLQKHPNDTEIVGLMTQVWLDAGQHESALRYWEREHAKNPKDTEVIGILAGIQRQAGNWEKAVEWYYKAAEVMTSPEGKADSFMNVGKLAANKLLNREQVFWSERLEIADIGIAALQKAVDLMPKNPDAHMLLGGLYALRSEAHQASWAQMIDKSSGRQHYSLAAALKRELEGDTAQPPGGEPQPAGDAQGSGDQGGAATPGEGGEAPQGNEQPHGDGAEGGSGAGSEASPASAASAKAPAPRTPGEQGAGQ